MSNPGMMQNVKYYEDMSLDIEYVINQTYNWDHSSPNFYINNEKKDKCFLRIVSNDQGSYTHQLEISLSFLNKTENISNTYIEFEITIWFNKSRKGHTFKLTKDSDSNTYKSGSYHMYESSINSHSQTFVNVKISYRKIDISDTQLYISSYENLLLSEAYADLKLKVGSTTFNVHKCIISSRCDVLKKMIEIDMLEKKTGEIVFSSWDPIVIKEILSYIYTNKCEIGKVSNELFKLAHFLELTELEQRCNQYLLSNVNLKNIINILELTDVEQYNLYELKKVANDFVLENELTLVQDIEFQEYLVNSIKMNNIHFILRIAKIHKLNEMMSLAMKFLIQNYKEVLENEECRTFLQTEPDLMIKILEYSFHFYTTQLKENEKSNE